MRAADTNVLLRVITGDDPDQERIVQDVLAAERLIVPLTVTLETAWVLRSYYKMTRDQVATALINVMELSGFSFERPDGVRWACDRLRAGAEIDDMLHLVAAASVEATAFVTFDDDIRKRTLRDRLLRVDVLG